MVFHYPGGGSSFRPIPTKINPTAHKPVSPAQPGNRIFGGSVPAIVNIPDSSITHSQGFSTAQNIIRPVFERAQSFFPHLAGMGYNTPKGGLRPL